MSKRTISVLLIVLGLVIIYLSYQFVYKSNKEKQDAMETEIASLQTDIDTYDALIANKDKYEKTIKEDRDDIHNKAKEFTQNARYEDLVMRACQLEDLLNEDEDGLQDLHPDEDEEEPKEKPKTDDEDEEEEKSPKNVRVVGIHFDEPACLAQFIMEADEFNFYQEPSYYEYSSSYEALKPMIQFCCDDEGTKRIIDYMDIDYNRDNGECTGRVGFSTFLLTGISNTYKPETIPEPDRSTDNIFGGIKGAEKETEEGEQL
jgi:hypothetical protein